MMALTLSFYGICSISIVKLYDFSLNKYLFRYDLYFRIVASSLVLATILHVCNLGFTLTAMPIAIAISYPLLHLCLFKIIPNWKLSDPFEKIFAVIMLINAVHFLDFPFLRKNIEFAPIGFSIAFAFMLIFTVFFPIFISKYLERRNVLDLERKVNSRTKELNLVKEEKAQLLNVLCHDLSTPLMVIEINLKKVMKKLAQNNIEEKGIERSDFAIKKLKAMLNQVRNMSSIEEGKQNIENKEFKLSEVVNNLKQIHIDMITQKELNFNCFLKTKENCSFYGNEQIITNEILSNFITNSIKFTDPGGSISVTIDGNESLIKIIIKDNGHGMCKKSIEAIYNNVKKSEVGTKGETGSGLGMSIALFYLKKMNATIEINSSTLKESTNKDYGTEVIIQIADQSTST